MPEENLKTCSKKNYIYYIFSQNSSRRGIFSEKNDYFVSLTHARLYTNMHYQLVQEKRLWYYLHFVFDFF